MSLFCRLAVWLLLTAVFPVGVSLADKAGLDSKSIADRKAELERIKSELETKRAELKILERQEESLLEHLEAIDEELSLGARLIAKIDRQAKALEQSLEKNEAELNENLMEFSRRQELMRQRLIWIYKRVRLFSLPNILAAPDFREAAGRYYFFKVMNKYDRRLIDHLKSVSAEIEAGKDTLIQKIVAIRKLKEEKEAETEMMAKNRLIRKALIDRLRLQKTIQQQSIMDLTAAQEKIEALLGRSPDKAESRPYVPVIEFSSLKGKLPWPVEGKVIRSYGRVVDNKFKTAILNPGLDIGAALGKPVSAVAAGRVTHISWLRGYGSFIIIEHGADYYSLYAHLDEIVVETGQELDAGELLGSVGESGSIAGPFLHFELRRGKEHMDPRQWLK